MDRDDAVKQHRDDEKEQAKCEVVQERIAYHCSKLQYSDRVDHNNSSLIKINAGERRGGGALAIVPRASRLAFVDAGLGEHAGHIIDRRFVVSPLYVMF